MPKLYFRYGTVSCAKTANLLLVAHNYRQQGKRVLLVKPSIDTRSGLDKIYSRCGLENKADIILNEKQNILQLDIQNPDCILCDESQFFTKEQIKQLRYIATYKNIPVICYGLKTDYKGELFRGSYTLLCLADSIEEIKTICAFCNKKSIMNLKIGSQGPTNNGSDEPDLGFEDKYVPTCYEHYFSKLHH
jgi:thymidine kinase